MAPNMKTEVGEVPRPKARKWPDPARVSLTRLDIAKIHFVSPD